MICCVIANHHPMLGVDLHDSFPAFISPPLPRGPHLVGAMVHWGPWWMAGAKEAADVLMPPGRMMSSIFDIGMLIPHVPLCANVYFWLYILTSSSQAHFGVASVRTSKGPIAAALMLYANPQLQCEGPLTMPPAPTAPTAMVLAPNTVVAGMTIGDVIAGFVTMALTSALTFGITHGLNVAIPGLTNAIMNGLIRVVSPRVMLPAVVAGVAAATKFPATAAIARKIAETVIGFGIGSPMGYAFEGAPLGTSLDGAVPFGMPSVQDVGDSTRDWVGDPFGVQEYFDDVALLPPFPLGPAPVPMPVPLP
ncbi:MAG: hypothetical protein KC486_34195 [Myxococcales bacterium]|nr:hypothetical protein [Myxococcales bacterium]